MYFYDNFIDNLSQSPMEDYKESTQAFIDGQWLDTNLLKTVEEEIEIGLFKFSEIQVWKNSISDFSINMVKNAKDFRRLMFQDINHDSTRGRFYRFNDNYWIVYEETSEEEMYPEVSVRRCNNIAKWVDTETGFIHEVPCTLDYTISSTSPHTDKDIDTANSSVTLILQGNINTHKITKNQRFIFSGQPFKFASYNNYMQNDYVTQDTPLLFMDLDLDMIQDDDDLVNNIANRYSYVYNINIIQDNTSQVNGFSGQLNAQVKFNNEIVDRTIVWESNEFATITQDGKYTLNGSDGSVAVFKAYIEGNTTLYDEVSIEIVSTTTNVLELVVDPLHEKINANKTNIFTVTLYKDGVAQSDIVTYVESGVDSSCYSLTQNGNQFTLIGKKPSSTPLTLTFTSGTVTKSIDIRLKSAF